MVNVVNVKEVLDYCLKTFDGTVLVESRGEKCIFYNPESMLKRGVYILAIKEKDGDNERSSMLNRDGIYRINIGLAKQAFEDMFKFIPERPMAGGVVDMPYDFSTVGKLFRTLFMPGWGW